MEIWYEVECNQAEEARYTSGSVIELTRTSLLRRSRFDWIPSDTSFLFVWRGFLIFVSFLHCLVHRALINLTCCNCLQVIGKRRYSTINTAMLGMHAAQATASDQARMYSSTPPAPAPVVLVASPRPPDPCKRPKYRHKPCDYKKTAAKKTEKRVRKLWVIEIVVIPWNILLLSPRMNATSFSIFIQRLWASQFLLMALCNSTCFGCFRQPLY